MLVSTCAQANTELKDRGGTVMGGLKKKLWMNGCGMNPQFQGCTLESRKSCTIKKKSSVKTHLVLQNYLVTSMLFLLLQSNPHYMTAI